MGVIRFGLMAVRGVGEKAVEAIIEERKKRGQFSSLYDFCERIDARQVTRATIEALVKCGAFTSTQAKRSQLLAILDRAVEMGQQFQQDKRMGQLSMFGAAEGAVNPSRSGGDALPEREEFPLAELLKFEKELLGFYITSHPLTEHLAALRAYGTATTREAKIMPTDAEITIGGLIGSVRKRATKTGRSAGQQMAQVMLEDLEGQIEVTIFAESLTDILKRYPKALDEEQIVFVKGRIDRRRETPGLVVAEIIPIEDAVSRLTRGMKIEIDTPVLAQDVLSRIKAVLSRNNKNGKCETYLEIPAQNAKKVTIKLRQDWSVVPSMALKTELETILNGKGKVELAGEGTRRARKLQQQPLFEAGEAVAVEAPPVEELEYSAASEMA